MPALTLCSAILVFSLPVFYENFAGTSRKPVADFIGSSTQYDIYKIQSAVVIEEVQTRDIKVKEPLDLVHLQTVSYKKKIEEMVTTGNLSGKESVYDLKQSLDKKIAAVNSKYYVQVGSWKNSRYAKRILMKLKKDYPEATIVAQNNFNKVRIPGPMTRKQAAIIFKDIEGKLNIRPLIVRGIYNVSLDDAVRPFIGTSYTKINCFGLIARGLMNQGVQYHGRGGLREKLENLAEHDGLPNNAYLNGEGLVEKAGMKVFSRFISKISNVREKTDELYSEIALHLREGLILSFSTSSRGHTGIVSRRENDWTYINSGIIDNEISSGEVSKKVGEEFLKAEIKNWFDLAASRTEPLTVTLGRLDVDQLQHFDGLKEKNELTALNIYQP
ncbi:MAG: SPOR domain-containing protein [Nitrospirota bacterium]